MMNFALQVNGQLNLCKSEWLMVNFALQMNFQSLQN